MPLFIVEAIMMEIIVFLMRIFQTIIHLWMQVWEDPFAEKLMNSQVT